MGLCEARTERSTLPRRALPAVAGLKQLCTLDNRVPTTNCPIEPTVALVQVGTRLPGCPTTPQSRSPFEGRPRAGPASFLDSGGAAILDADLLTRLYRTHARALRRVRNDQRRLYANRGNLQLERIASCLRLRSMLERLGMPAEYHRLIKPQLDDLEAEATYLLVREFRPRTIVEISPDGGWSTTWLLAALRDNGSGSLFSYDMFDHCTRTVPKELAEGRWTFTLGDVRDHLRLLPPRIDYLFLDSAHSAHFARWYIRDLFPRLAPGTPVSIHDIFAASAGESRVVRRWLSEQGVHYFTTAPTAAADVYHRLLRVKHELGMARPIHDSRRNPMVFFQVPQKAAAREASRAAAG